MIYNVNEIFYSIKGEGRWTGTPMSFIRLQGCNLDCDFCDTKDKLGMRLTEQQLVERISVYPSRKVVITGGEPTIQDLGPLVDILDDAGLDTHLETNGLLHIPWRFSWVAISPKTRGISSFVMGLANEIKFLCGAPMWDLLVEYYMLEFDLARTSKLLYLMPLAKNYKDGDRSITDLSVDNTMKAINYCKAHPEFALCVQLHKVLEVP